VPAQHLEKDTIPGHDHAFEQGDVALDGRLIAVESRSWRLALGVRSSGEAGTGLGPDVGTMPVMLQEDA
jgi:hypothetical protein